MRNLIEYLPPFLKNVREYNKIFEAEDIELQEIYEIIEKALSEIIVSTAESYGLTRYESIYSITKAESIEARRANILLKLNDRIPYSYWWLINYLNTCIGEEYYSIDINYDNYKLSLSILSLFDEMAQMLDEELRMKIPANLELEVTLFQDETSTQYFGGVVHTGDNIEIRQVS